MFHLFHRPNIFKANGHLFFRANDGIHGNELWKTDGTTLGTRLCKDIFPEKEVQIQDIMQKTMVVYISKQMMVYTVVNCGNSILVNFKKLN